LVHAAHEFEAQMMKELLQPMTASNVNGEDDDSSSGSGGALGEFASEALGRGLSEMGGFGIASSIVRQLAHEGNKSATMQVTGKLHGNTVMKTYE
jgi:Rod binding domain-containing protein